MYSIMGGCDVYLIKKSFVLEERLNDDAEATAE
jgi:hypothetical protein